jgi:hypothetical protein
MAKTALELTPEEQLAYRPREAIERRQEAENRQGEERWQQAQRLARQAAKVLYEEFGAVRVLLFLFWPVREVSASSSQEW